MATPPGQAANSLGLFALGNYCKSRRGSNTLPLLKWPLSPHLKHADDVLSGLDTPWLVDLFGSPPFGHAEVKAANLLLSSTS